MANKVILLGRLGKDPVIKHFQNDSAIAEFTLATTDNYKDREGKWVDVTDWHNIKLPNKYMAERSEKYLVKGSEVFIEGKLKTRSYEKDGVTKYITEVVADRFELVGKKSEQNGEPKDQARAEQEQAEQFAGNQTDDSLPF